MRSWRTPRRVRSGEDGAAMIEFAIVTPLLIMLVFGVIDFGRAFFMYNGLSSVVRDGARFAASLSCSQASAAVVKTRVETVTFQNYFGATATAPNVTVTFHTDSVRVGIQNYQYQPWTPVIPQAQAVRFTVSSVFPREDPPPC